MFQGTGEHMTKELMSFAPSTMKVQWLLHQSESARHGPSSFQQMWTSKGGFDESGPCVVHKRCTGVAPTFNSIMSHVSKKISF